MATITALDVNWADHPHSIGAALLESDGHRSLIDPGPASTLATLRQLLGEHNLTVADLDAILLTHIHLDHAGASGSLVRENPTLPVYVHKNGAPHMSDPSKLIASAYRLWGERLDFLFGAMVAVPQDNLRILEGGETLEFGARKLEIVYTPGHASHHVSYFDQLEGVAFVGDTTGVRIDDGPYILPATPPPDIDLPLWDKSFAEITARKPKRLFLTHYGFANDPAAHVATFRERLHRWCDEAELILRSATDEAAALQRFLAFANGDIAKFLSPAMLEHYAFTAGLGLSFAGLARHIRKRAQQKVP
jgi:glyoxylase-like metal-dependent hydrolase (beta-lactamase superfamily II)